MAKRDYYEILGVERNASPEQIKRAFRNKARHLHPDVESGDEEAFKELAAAYEVLSDEQKRSLYDRYGEDGLTSSARSFDGVDFGAFSDLGEIFNQFFGGGSRSGFNRNAPERGADLKYDLQLDFLEAVFGAEKKVSIKHLEECTICKGSGAAVGSGPITCSTCSGQGQIRQTASTFLGQFTQVLTCPSCRGEGTRIDKPCSDCKGKGQIQKVREIDLPIPPGIDNGARLRVPNIGDQGRRGGGFGDLYVIVHVDEHPDFIREGMSIHLKQKISFSTAALGGEITVPTVDGTKPLKIPAGTQSGTALVMREHGVPQLNNLSKRGDQIVHLQVETPIKLSLEERQLFEKLAQLRDEKQNATKVQKKNEHKKETKSKEKNSSKDSNIMNKLADLLGGKDDDQGA